MNPFLVPPWALPPFRVKGPPQTFGKHNQLCGSTTEHLSSENVPSGTPEPRVLVDLRGSLGDGVSTLGPLGPDNAPFGAPEPQRLMDLHGIESDGETSDTLSTISNVLEFPVPIPTGFPRGENEVLTIE
ncbi:uncharacterized protein N7498_009579 [Penicillium cinerascens]|uniref:Uncharacterized protein n=1 Tax=Penicillium cinerascens TaxID=70096 RepID=A0A9W9J6D6_9EURO|nr:uncharacterized protein N7498_009579 [Penicillium cinerascens]KAJ5190594.1 hypothetical protein N7498_009579 [Penicillium cinerascens]